MTAKHGGGANDYWCTEAAARIPPSLAARATCMVRYSMQSGARSRQVLGHIERRGDHFANVKMYSSPPSRLERANPHFSNTRIEPMFCLKT